jgi:7-carboxy-7-deazaguanine synthase
MVVTEIFRSIQGESTFAGLPCVFIRLTGCNLRCRWCDTAYAFYGGTQMAVDEVLGKVSELSRAPEASPAAPAAPTPEPARGQTAGQPDQAQPIRLVEITGGEPLLQPEVYSLAERLLATGYEVLVETSGERFVGRLPREVVKIVDVKCPDSKEGGSFDPANLEALDGKDEIKFVIASRRDYEFARAFTRAHRLAERIHQVLFSPATADPDGAWAGLEPRELAEWILADGLEVRLGLQLHKFIWDARTRGV